MKERNIGILECKASLTSSLTNTGRGCLEVLPNEKTVHIFFYFSLLFSIIKWKSRRRRWRAVYISMRRTLHVFYFSGFFYYLREKENWVQFRILQLATFPLIWNNLVSYSVQVYNSTYQPIKACWISGAFFQFILRNTRKMSSDKSFKSYETWKWNIIRNK